MTTTIPYGVSSMSAELTDVVVTPPTDAFAGAFERPEHGFRHPVDIGVARREHAGFRQLLTDLGVRVHLLDGSEHPSPDAIYAYDPSLVSDDGAILLRLGKPTRRGEEQLHASWYRAHGIPIRGRIESPGTVDGGDVLWLRPELVVVGRSLRTNQAGIDQLVVMTAAEVVAFDVPYDRGPAECLHLMSLISPLADDLVLVERGRLPAGLWGLLSDLGIRTIDVAPEEVDTLACNVLAVRPGVAVMVEGNPLTRARIEQEGIAVHTFPGEEICLNGSGGPTCLTRPIRRTR